MVTHTQNLCSAFNPSKCTHTPWTHTRSSGQPMLRCPGSSRAVSPQSWYWRCHRQFLPARDSNPQPRVTSPMLYPLGHDCPKCVSEYMRLWEWLGVPSPNLMTLASVMPESWNAARYEVIMSNGQSTNSVSLETAKWNHCIRSSQAGEEDCMVLHHFLKLAYTAILSNNGNKAEWHWERRLTVATSHRIE